MKNKAIKTAAIAVALVIAHQAMAGAPEQPKSGGVYVGAHGGAAFPSGSGSGLIDTGYVVGGQVGYKFQNNFRAELSGDYINHSGSVGGVTGTISLYDVLVTGYYDFNLGNFIPFIGAGIGYLNGSVSVSFAGTTVTGYGQGAFAYQGTAGIGYQITPRVVINVAYRYLGATNSGGGENIIQAGLDFYFH